MRAPNSVTIASKIRQSLLDLAPGIAWRWFFLSWFVSSLALEGGLLYQTVRRQQEHLLHQADFIGYTLENTLDSSTQIIEGLADIVNAEPHIDEAKLDHFADQAASHFKHIYTMGVQPRVQQFLRSSFEATRSARLRRPFKITESLPPPERNWNRSSPLRAAPVRENYYPWIMQVPPPPEHADRLEGLDLLNDALLGPSLMHALHSAEIEITPSLRLSDGSSVVGFIKAVYSPDPPSESPLMRPEQAIGMVTLFVRNSGLLDLTQEQSDTMNVVLARQEGAPGTGDPIVFQHQANQSSNRFDSLLPKFEQRILLDEPYFPYELDITLQMRFASVSAGWASALPLVALFPSALILMLFIVRHQARRRESFADETLFRARAHAIVTLQAISDAVITVDPLHTVLYINPAAIKLLDTTTALAVGHNVNDVFDLRYEFSSQFVRHPLDECMTQNKMVDLAENSYLLRRNGEKLLIEGTASPLQDKTGAVIGSALTFRDTAPLRRRMLDALENSEARLKQHENELAHVTRVTSMGEMASGIAHEINQPLSAIMSYCQASLSLLEDEEPNIELIASAIQSAITQADRAGKIVRRLREFVSNKKRHHTPVDVNNAVNNALGLSEFDLANQNIHLDFRPGANIPLVYADTIQLEQVILNLIRNAIDAMQNHPEPAHLQIETRFNADRACITLADNGSGIPEENLSRLFTPFFSTKMTGMGLGLTICQTIIENFGGRISAFNRAGGGAEFVIELPPLKQKQLDSLTHPNRQTP